LNDQEMKGQSNVVKKKAGRHAYW